MIQNKYYLFAFMNGVPGPSIRHTLYLLRVINHFPTIASNEYKKIHGSHCRKKLAVVNP